MFPYVMVFGVTMGINRGDIFFNLKRKSAFECAVSFLQQQCDAIERLWTLCAETVGKVMLETVLSSVCYYQERMEGMFALVPSVCPLTR